MSILNNFSAGNIFRFSFGIKRVYVCNQWRVHLFFYRKFLVFVNFPNCKTLNYSAESIRVLSLFHYTSILYFFSPQIQNTDFQLLYLIDHRLTASLQFWLPNNNEKKREWKMPCMYPHLCGSVEDSNSCTSFMSNLGAPPLSQAHMKAKISNRFLLPKKLCNRILYALILHAYT